MFSLVTNPGEALMEAKKERSLGKALMELVVAAVLLGIATFLVGSQLVAPFASVPFVSQGVQGGIALLAVAVFVGVLLFGLVAGYAGSLIFRTLGGTGDFTAGVTPLSYSLFLSAIGVIVAVVLNFIPYGIGAFLGALVLIYFFALAMSTVFRGYKELFEVDMVTTLVGVSILWAVFTTAVTFSIMLDLSQVVTSLAPAFGVFSGGAVTG